ncbi:MAG: DEAD/DEAH box helicase, partial [Chloroflexota bacterium]
MTLDLSGLLPIIQSLPAYSRLRDCIRKDAGEVRAAVLEAAKPAFMAALHREMSRPILLVVAHSEGAKRVQEELIAWCGPGCSVGLFPEPDALPYERLSSDSSTLRQRLRVLALLSRAAAGDGGPTFIVASVRALCQKTISPSDFAAAAHSLHHAERASLDHLLRRWDALGYQMENSVEQAGTMARRGGIIDIYPPNADFPTRIELFGDQIESLRVFDPATQRSVGIVDSLEIVPAREVIVPDDVEPARLLAEMHLAEGDAELRERVERDLNMLLELRPFDSQELYSSLFNHGCLMEYLPERALLVLDEPSELAAALEGLDLQAQDLRCGAVEREELPASFPVPYFSWEELKSRAESLRCRLSLCRWGDGEETGSPCLHLPFLAAPALWGKLHQTVEAAQRALHEERRLVVVSQQASRLTELLDEGGVIVAPKDGLSETPPRGSVSVVKGSLNEGWALEDTTVLTDRELFGFTKQRRSAKRIRRPAEDLFDLKMGDYAVHAEHGIARFGGMVTMAADGIPREYLLLEYAAGDKLYVPTDQIERVSRYIGPGTHVPALSRLGTQEWSRTRRRVKESVDQLARDLLAVYAAREVSPGIASSPDTSWQQELEASFPYEETSDQLQAVRDVKEDMERPKPMDRLVCGDVGYGKTEIALRAAFKAVMGGRQVAVLVPTTVLAQQHFTTFAQRLAAFPVTVEVLSRFRSEKEQQQVLEGLEDGSVDICIGTHRLLQKDVAFKNLGLVVVDEEQRFGVNHKEHLKQLRQEVDVLTLSATPIPRTLYMSLSGLRDMSTMETPPEERLPIKTYVAEYNERLIREAILRELERGGQVFFVHN